MPINGFDICKVAPRDDAKVACVWYDEYDTVYDDGRIIIGLTKDNCKICLTFAHDNRPFYNEYCTAILTMHNNIVYTVYGRKLRFSNDARVSNREHICAELCKLAQSFKMRYAWYQRLYDYEHDKQNTHN